MFPGVAMHVLHSLKSPPLAETEKINDKDVRNTLVHNGALDHGALQEPQSDCFSYCLDPWPGSMHFIAVWRWCRCSGIVLLPDASQSEMLQQQEEKTP